MKFKLNDSGGRTSQLSQTKTQTASWDQRSATAVPRWYRHALGGICSFLFALSCSVAAPASAAERLTLRIGPFQQSMTVNELERFAKTGELPSSLQPLELLLTPQIRQILTRRLEVEPSIANRFLDELLGSPDGKQLIEQLAVALPGSSIEQLKAALYLSLQQADGLSVIDFLRAYPQENITVDATSAIGIAVQLNASYLQSQLLAPVLERELNVEENQAFRPSFDPAAAGEEQVREWTLRLEDHKRQRTINVDLYYSANTKLPFSSHVPRLCC